MTTPPRRRRIYLLRHGHVRYNDPSGQLVADPDALSRYSVRDVVELAGSQGVEVLNWIAMRGALTGTVTEAHRNYHIPISNTAAATMLLENRPVAVKKAA